MINEQLMLVAVKDKVFTVGDLKNALTNVGIEKGDDICVHSQIYGFGKPLIDKQKFLQVLIEVLLEQIGNEGTLIMPTFSYSFCNGETYDVLNSSSTVGLLTETFRTYPKVKRTHHPIFSFAVRGKRKEEYLDIGPDAFGLDSVYGKLMQNKGKVVMFGANVGYTVCYMPEEHVSVSYRYFKEFEGTIRYEDGTERHVSVPYYVRNLEAEHNDLSEPKVAQFLLDTGIQKQVGFGKGTIGVFDIKEMYEEYVMSLRKDEGRFLK